MSKNLPISLFEERLIKEIHDINQKIDELTKERRAVERLLLRARRENAASQSVVRKNSFGRVLIEKVVLDMLRAAKGPVYSRALLKAAREVDFDLKDVTFRSYLRRMKVRELIENPKGKSGLWQLRGGIEQSS